MESQACCDVLVGLPSDLSTSILLKWLDARHVCAVDSAYCGSKNRPHLLSLFSCEQFVLPRTELPCDQKPSFLHWLCSRSVRAEKVEILDEVQPCVVEYFKKVGNAVKDVSFHKVDFVQNTGNAQHFIKVLQACTRLEALKLEDCSLSKTVVDEILQCSTLRDLRINQSEECYAEHEEFQLNTLSPTKALDLVTLSITGGFFSAPVFWEHTSPHNLQVLGLTLTPDFTSTHIKDKFAQCTKLNALSLSYVEEPENPPDQFAELLNLCPQIEHLEVHPREFEPDFATVLADLMENLKTLCLCECTFVDDVFEQLVERGNTQLEAVYLEHCQEYFTGEGLNNLIENCTNLRMLYVNGFGAGAYEGLDNVLLDQLTTLRVTFNFEGFEIVGLKVVHYGLFVNFPDSTAIEELEDLEVFPTLEVLEVAAGVKCDFTDIKAARPNLHIRRLSYVLTYDFCDVALGITQ